MSARQKMFVTPAAGRSVPKNKNGDLLAPGGELLVVTPWLRRRERDGDVSITERAPRRASKKEEA